MKNDFVCSVNVLFFTCWIFAFDVFMLLHSNSMGHRVERPLKRGKWKFVISEKKKCYLVTVYIFLFRIMISL